MSWQQIPGGLKQISVGSQNHVWGVNAADQIWRRDGDNWTLIPGGLKCVSVAADGTVWGVNAADQIWRRDGDNWTLIPGALKQISVGSQYHIWGVNAADQIWQWTGSGWTQIPGGLKWVSVGVDGTVWGVNAADQIWRRDGDNWTLIPGGLKQISVGSQNHVWGVNAADQIWRRDGDNWTLIPGGLKCVSVAADGTVWGVNADDQIWTWTGWTQIPGGLKQISVGSQNQVWGVNAADQIWRRDGDNWILIPGGLKCVSAAADGTVWGVNAADQIWRRDGDNWTQIPGGLKQISVGSQNQVWGVNAADQIWQWTGSGWTQIPGGLKCVSVAADGTVWGVNAGDQIWRRDGDNWTQIPGGLKQISVGSQNQVWGVNAGDQIWQWTGSGWTQIPGGLKWVSAAADGTVWGVNADDQIWTWNGSTTGLLEDAAQLKAIVADQASRTVVVPIAGASSQVANSTRPSLSPAKARPRRVEVATNVPRSQLSVPVCPSDPVTDEVLFEAAADAGQKLYLPRYRLAEEVVSGQTQYQISLAQGESGWGLTVYLEAYPAPPIEQESRQARIIEHRIDVILIYQWRGQQKELEFQEVSRETEGQKVKAVLLLNGLEERDMIYQALTDATYGASLLVLREVRVATPLEPSRPGGAGPKTVTIYPEADSYVSEQNHGSNFGLNQFLDVAPQAGVSYSGQQHNAYLRFDLGSIPTGGSIKSAIFQMTSTTGFAYGGDGNQYVHFVSDDNWAEAALSWDNKPALEAPLGFWWTWYGYPVGGDVNNRTFTVDLTAQAVAESAGNRKLSLGLTSPGYWVRYFSRHEGNEAYRPQLIVSYDAYYREVIQVVEDTVDDTFFFPAQLHRYMFLDLEAAGGQGSGLIQKRIQWNGNWYNYYQDSRARYRFYYLPERFEIGRSSDSQKPSMSLRFESLNGSSDPENLLAKLQYYAAPVVDAERLNAAGAELMRREKITLPTGVSGLEFIPLQGEKNQFQLDLPHSNGSSGAGQQREPRVSLKDGIFDTLTLPLADFQEIWDALFSREIQNTLFTGQVKVNINEGVYSEQIPFEARLADNPADLFSAILDPHIVDTYQKTLQVRAFSPMFEPPSARPEDQIIEIWLDFGAETISLTATNLSTVVTLTRSLREIILDQADPGLYRYQLNVIRKSGLKDYGWRETSMEIIYPDIEKK